MKDGNKTKNKTPKKVVVEISSAFRIAEYLHSIGFLLTTIGNEDFEEQKFSEVLEHTQNFGRLIQDLAYGQMRWFMELSGVKEENKNA